MIIFRDTATAMLRDNPGLREPREAAAPGNKALAVFKDLFPLGI